MALGNVLIGADVGGTNELIIQNVTGYLVKPRTEILNQKEQFNSKTDDILTEVKEYENAFVGLLAE